MGSRILVTFSLEVEVIDQDDLVGAAMVADEATQAWARPAEATAELHDDMRKIPSLALRSLLDPQTIMAHVPGVQVTGSKLAARDLADDERLFPRPGERPAAFPPV
jgi:hypothetical protein